MSALLNHHNSLSDGFGFCFVLLAFFLVPFCFGTLQYKVERYCATNREDATGATVPASVLKSNVGCGSRSGQGAVAVAEGLEASNRHEAHRRAGAVPRAGGAPPAARHAVPDRVLHYRAVTIRQLYIDRHPDYALRGMHCNALLLYGMRQPERCGDVI